MQGVGARGATDGVFDAQVFGRLFLERLHVRPQNERAIVQRFAETADDFILNFRILRLQIDHRDHSGRPLAMG